MCWMLHILIPWKSSNKAELLHFMNATLGWDGRDAASDGMPLKVASKVLLKYEIPWCYIDILNHLEQFLNCSSLLCEDTDCLFSRSKCKHFIYLMFYFSLLAFFSKVLIPTWHKTHFRLTVFLILCQSKGEVSRRWHYNHELAFSFLVVLII